MPRGKTELRRDQTTAEDGRQSTERKTAQAPLDRFVGADARPQRMFPNLLPINSAPHVPAFCHQQNEGQQFDAVGPRQKYLILIKKLNSHETYRIPNSVVDIPMIALVLSLRMNCMRKISSKRTTMNNNSTCRSAQNA